MLILLPIILPDLNFRMYTRSSLIIKRSDLSVKLVRCFFIFVKSHLRGRNEVNWNVKHIIYLENANTNK